MGTERKYRWIKTRIHKLYFTLTINIINILVKLMNLIYQMDQENWLHKIGDSKDNLNLD